MKNPPDFGPGAFLSAWADSQFVPLVHRDLAFLPDTMLRKKMRCFGFLNRNTVKQNAEKMTLPVVIFYGFRYNVMQRKRFVRE